MTIEPRILPLKQRELADQLTDKVVQVARQPEHSWGDGFRSFMTDDLGRPVVRLGIVQCEPTLDIWQGLRSPAAVGMYPVGLDDVWMHYAAANVRSTRADGSPNPLAMPETFDEALGRFRRAVIISGMLAINPSIFAAFAAKIERGDADPVDDYNRARTEASDLINKAVARLGLSLMAENRAVVPMTAGNAAKVIDGTRSEYTKGRYHGPCNSHWPQTSIAVMTGLLRFGVNRLPFRDEVFGDGRVRRLMGRCASIVLFDDQPVADGDAPTVLDADRLAWMRRVNDYADVDGKVVSKRYCTYNLAGADGASTCARCVDACPSEAVPHSVPARDGVYSPDQLSQTHRFVGGMLDFDAGNCTRERNQKGQLYPDYACGRCEAICAARGVCRRPEDITRINQATGE
ncbi:MAG: hypothetical protein ACYS5V_08230 [Planctomycetota bacterium]|jgi:hypothetical protein